MTNIEEDYNHKINEHISNTLKIEKSTIVGMIEKKINRILPFN